MPQGLGRGLSSLIPKKNLTYGRNPFAADGESADSPRFSASVAGQVLKISPDEISINPRQPRRYFAENALNDLAESIRQHGIIQPLIVTRTEVGFELIAGERRWRSAKMIGLKEVPVIVREEAEQKKLELALIENLQRENLNPLEVAEAYRQLMDEFNITQEEAAKRVGKARSSVANSLRLLTLPEGIKLALAENRISEAHAKYLLSLDDDQQRMNMLKKILRQNLTVADTGREVKRLSATGSQKARNYADLSQENELSEHFGTKVELRRQKRGGRIIINFYSEDELDGILKKMRY